MVYISRPFLCFFFVGFIDLLSFLKSYEITILSLCVCLCPFQLPNHLKDFHDIWYKLYVIRGHRNIFLFSILRIATTT
jgi:hypothetical protein